MFPCIFRKLIHRRSKFITWCCQLQIYLTCHALPIWEDILCIRSIMIVWWEVGPKSINPLSKLLLIAIFWPLCSTDTYCITEEREEDISLPPIVWWPPSYTTSAPKIGQTQVQAVQPCKYFFSSSYFHGSLITKYWMVNHTVPQHLQLLGRLLREVTAGQVSQEMQDFAAILQRDLPPALRRVATTVLPKLERRTTTMTWR